MTTSRTDYHREYQRRRRPGPQGVCLNCGAAIRVSASYCAANPCRAAKLRANRALTAAGTRHAAFRLAST